MNAPPLAVCAIALSFALSSCAAKQPPHGVPATASRTWSTLDGAPSDGEIPPVDREFRAAWVATVANIDWPSRPGLSTAQQQAEALAILNKAAALNLNAVIFQARSSADAMYASTLEPWSHYLTGKQGQAPDPYYDPLQFWVDQAHARGLELHVWCNPYRVRPAGATFVFSGDSVPTKYPRLVRTLADGTMWMDPAMPETQEHGRRVLMDIVRRYDVDAIHLDDYFYPYPSYNGGKDFPDDETWKVYTAGGGKMARGDWRRNAVNGFIRSLYTDVKREKPRVKVGLSPFGLYRPGYPRSIEGFDQYAELYADARLWFREGWVDYFAPQLYWPSGQIPQSFPILLAWWQAQNVQHRHLWPGLATYRVERDPAGPRAPNAPHNIRPPSELLAEVMTTRAIVPNGPGHVHYSMRHLMTNHEGIGDLLRGGAYRTRALVPPSPWLDATPPLPPSVTATQVVDQLSIEWTTAGPEAAFVWVVYIKQAGAWRHEILPGHVRRLAVQNRGTAKAVEAVAVTAVDRTGNESSKTPTRIAATAGL